MAQVHRWDSSNSETRGAVMVETDFFITIMMMGGQHFALASMA